MAKAAPFANGLLDAIYNGGASGTVVIGANTYTLPFHLMLLATASTAAVQGSEWPGTGGYSTGGISLAGLYTVVAAGQSKSNTGSVVVLNAPSTPWAGVEIVDATGQRLVFAPDAGPLVLSPVNSGDTVVVPIGALIGYES